MFGKHLNVSEFHNVFTMLYIRFEKFRISSFRTFSRAFLFVVARISYFDYCTSLIGSTYFDWVSYLESRFTPRPPPYPKPKPGQLKVSPEELGVEMQPKSANFVSLLKCIFAMAHSFCGSETMPTFATL